jgi:hypothetical protein
MNGVKYYFRITAVDSAGLESEYSNEMSATPIGLVAYYPFNGNANDSSGNGHNGTVNGTTLTTDRYGNANKAYNFDGYHEIVVPHSDALNIVGDMTVSAWFNSYGPPLFRNNHTIVTKRSSNPYLEVPYDLTINYQYGIPSDYKKPMFVSAANNVVQYIQSVDTVINNTWNHIAYTISGSNIKMFLNDIAILDSPIDNQMRNTNTYPLLIGSAARIDKPSEQFVGKLDDIRIYNRALNQTDIDSLYHEGGWTGNTSPPTPTLISATPGDKQVNLKWSKNTALDFLRYRIYRSTSSPATTLIDSTNQVTDTVKTIAGLLNGTIYYFRVTAVDSAGLESEYSNELSSSPIGLVAYYPFNGNANDESGNGNNGTVNSVTATSDRFGDVNSAYSFNGVTSNIQVPNSSSLQPLSGISVAGWITPNGYYSMDGNTIVDKGTDDQVGWYGLRYLHASMKFEFAVRFSTGLSIPTDWIYVLSNTTINLGTNYFVCGTYDGNYIKIYVNGVQEVSLQRTGSIPQNLSPMSIGKHNLYGYSYFTKGVIDDILIYNRALSSPEIDSIYHKGGWPFNTPPNAPQMISATPGYGSITLRWHKNSESDFLRYRIYGGTSSNPTTKIDSVFSITDTVKTIVGLTNGVTYYFRITAVDTGLLQSEYSNELSATPTNQPPVAVGLTDVYLPNEGRKLTTQLSFSSVGSYDPDGTINSIYWYVNGNLVGTQTSLTYYFGPGTSSVSLIVVDNDGARDTSSARVTRLGFKQFVNGPVYAGLSLLGDHVLYAIASGDAVYRMDDNGNILYTLEVGGEVRSASAIGIDTSVYITSSDRNLYAFSKYGTPMWPAVPLGGTISCTPTVDYLSSQQTTSRIYVGIENRNFVAVNRSGGSVAWSYFVDSPIRNSAIISIDKKLIQCTALI